MCVQLFEMEANFEQQQASLIATGRINAYIENMQEIETVSCSAVDVYAGCCVGVVKHRNLVIQLPILFQVHLVIQSNRNLKPLIRVAITW